MSPGTKLPHRIYRLDLDLDHVEAEVGIELTFQIHHACTFSYFYTTRARFH
jgi:hypothetical protein